MPTYEYVCPEGHGFELFQKMSDKPRAKCPACGKVASRKISGGAGLVFKGSGFYITDYGKDGKGPRKAPAEGGAGGASGAEAAPSKSEKDAKSGGDGAGKATKPAAAAKPAASKGGE